MSFKDYFRFDGKRVLVVGGATGMGSAVIDVLLDLGADVVAMDIAGITRPDVGTIDINLADRASIDLALERCGGEIHSLLSCAGVADGTPGIERINFIGHRHLIESLLARRMLRRGSTIGVISSAAGVGWDSDLERLNELLSTNGWDESIQWMRAAGWDNYLHTKRALCGYVAREAAHLLQQGIRINALCPGPTDTPLLRANAWGTSGAGYRADTGTQLSTSLEQALALVYLCSGAAKAISGQSIVSDQGFLMSGLTGSYPGATMSAMSLYGRIGAAESMREQA